MGLLGGQQALAGGADPLGIDGAHGAGVEAHHLLSHEVPLHI